MKYKIFFSVFIVSLISSIILYSNSLTGICDPDKGCDVVNSSSYGSTLGIKNSVYGMFVFSFMITLTLFHIRKPNNNTRRIIHAAVILGSVIALYFLYLQFFIIRVFCTFCMIIDFGLLISLIFLFYLWEH